MSEPVKPSSENKDTQSAEKETIVYAKPNPQSKSAIPVGNIEQIALAYAKSLNGWKISASIMTSYDDKKGEDPIATSDNTRRLITAYMYTGRGSVEEFVKSFVDAPIVYLQAHKCESDEYPVLCDDGVYGGCTASRKRLITKNLHEYILTEKDSFKPFIVFRTGSNSFGKVEGDPIRRITKAEAQAVMEALQGEQKKEDTPE